MTEGKISVVINTYNAEKHLRRVLDSVKGFDEVVVCDMESTDGTVAIAHEYGCKVVTFVKGDISIVEPARQFAIAQASYPWILVIDADELVPEALSDYLYHLITTPHCPQGLYLPRKNYFMGRFMHCNYPDYILRFFVREGTIWPPYIHTSPIVQGVVEHIPSGREDLALVHLADDSIKVVMKKINMYTENEIVRKAHKKYGLGALFYRPFFRFFKSYILKSGYLDGKEGFLCACCEGLYQFVLVAKIMERRSHSLRCGEGLTSPLK